MQKLTLTFFFVALIAINTFAQAESAPTLRVVVEDPRLPAELYYGDVKVKPVRLRPGTNQPVTVDDTDFFVQQQYVDFLNRFPEAAGFRDWTAYVQGCTAGDAECLKDRRVIASSGFFRSPEFFETGYFSYRLYVTSLGRYPRYVEFMPDARQLDYGVAGDRAEASKLAFAQKWVQRADFTALYPTDQPVGEYVQALAARAGVQLSSAERDALQGLSRAQILIKIADHPTVTKREFNPAFVRMQYFGYLRRDPEDKGFNDWLTYLNANPQDYPTMIWGFIYSPEYRNRF